MTTFFVGHLNMKHESEGKKSRATNSGRLPNIQRNGTSTDKGTRNNNERSLGPGFGIERVFIAGAEKIRSLNKVVCATGGSICWIITISRRSQFRLHSFFRRVASVGAICFDSLTTKSNILRRKRSRKKCVEGTRNNHYTGLIVVVFLDAIDSSLTKRWFSTNMITNCLPFPNFACAKTIALGEKNRHRHLFECNKKNSHFEPTAGHFTRCNEMPWVIGLFLYSFCKWLERETANKRRVRATKTNKNAILWLEIEMMLKVSIVSRCWIHFCRTQQLSVPFHWQNKPMLFICKYNFWLANDR